MYYLIVSVDQESRHGLARSQLSMVRLYSHLETQLRKDPLPSFPRFMAEFISLWLQKSW